MVTGLSGACGYLNPLSQHVSAQVHCLNKESYLCYQKSLSAVKSDESLRTNVENVRNLSDTVFMWHLSLL